MATVAKRLRTIVGARSAARRFGANFDSKARSYDTESKLQRAAWMADIIQQRPWFRSDPAAMGEALDFGCGTGILSFELLRHCRRITGLDISSGMRDVMTQKARDAGVESKVAVTGAPLEEMKAQFDFVFTSLAAHHVKDCGQFIQQLMQATRPGGRVLVIDFEEGPRSRLFHRAKEQKGVHFEHDGLQAPALTRWLEDAGGQSVDLVRVPFRKKLADDWERPGESEEFQMLFAAAAAPLHQPPNRKADVLSSGCGVRDLDPASQ